MHFFFFTILLASLSLGGGTALGSPASFVESPRSRSSGAGPYGLNNAACQEVHLKVPVSSQNVVFKDVIDDYDNAAYVDQQLLEYSTTTAAYTQRHITQEKRTVNATYDIYGQYCTPKRGARAGSSLLVAVHGGGFDHGYWDFKYKDYSFVSHAASHGYAVFAYDRLGCGKSSKPSKGGFSVVQAPHELAILQEILRQARETTNVGGRTKHGKITLVGHSYGSAQSQAASAQSPELVDGLVLTGFSTNSTGQNPFVLSGTITTANQIPDLPHLKKYPSIWVASASATGNLYAFTDPFYVEQAAAELSRSYTQPVTLGVLLSFAAISGPSLTYDKPVFVLNGQEDLPLCYRNCSTIDESGMTIIQSVSKLFPHGKNFTVATLPHTGHGIAFHPTAPQGNEDILSYLIANGL